MINPDRTRRPPNTYQARWRQVTEVVCPAARRRAVGEFAIACFSSRLSGFVSNAGASRGLCTQHLSRLALRPAEMREHRALAA